jgi:NhaP-type Na+/H+ or K+/H+ antiporter
LITFIVVEWHSGQTASVSVSSGARTRLLEQNVADVKEIDDDTTRDDVCKEYLMNFLNGTTDAKDECQGMLNAYQAADCADDSNTAVVVFKHHNASQEDDVLIDDFYEAWECCSSIYQYYTTHCGREPQLASYQLLGVVAVLVLCGFVKSLIRALRVEWIPDAAACIMVGAIVGGILSWVKPDFINESLSFNNNLFLHILLPPIVFQASLTIDKRAFRRDLFPILTFAIFGTILSTVVVGYLVHWLTAIGRGTHLPLLDSLVFGSLISSIDPVATLGILASVGVSQTDTLYTLIFGEALLNDGIAIVLFDTLVGHLGDETVVSRATLHETAKFFVQISLGSIGIGLACGIVCTMYFWALRRKHTPVVEVALFFCWALIPFYISDGAGYSGIISIMTMGFFLDFAVIGGSRCQSEDSQWMDYMQLGASSERLVLSEEGASRPSQFCCSLFKAFNGKGHLSRRSRHHVGFVAEVIASIMETTIYAYLGMFVFSEALDFRLNIAAIFACVTSRTVMVVVLSAVINVFVWLDLEGRFLRLFWPNRNAEDDSVDSTGSTAPVYLDKKTQQILILAGARGAVSFALVESIPVYDAVTKEGSLYKPQLKAMTSCSILFTVFVFGAWTYFLIKGEKDEQQARHRDGLLAHRLLSEPLISTIVDSDVESDNEESAIE